MLRNQPESPRMNPELISEPIVPDPGTADSSAMACAIPGLPTGFHWRDRHFEIAATLSSWKASEAYNHRPGGERYYRKHYYKIRTTTGDVMTLYALRQVKRGENTKRRWWLYTIEREA